MGFYNIYTEGQQAEEYLKRKQAQIDKDKEEDEKKHGKNVDQYSYGNKETYYSPGSRTGQKPTWQTRQRGYNDEDYKKSQDLHDPIGRNPRHAATMERQARHAELSKKYPDAVPSYRRTEDDDALDRAREKHKKELDYANRVAGKYAVSHGGVYPSDYQVGSPEYSKAVDAARKHYRRTHKNEACGIFECVEFLND